MAYGLTKSADLEAGSSQSLSRADNSLLDPTDAMTLEGWFNFETTPSATDYALVAKSDNSGGVNERQYFFRHSDNGGTLQLQLLITAVGSSYTDNAQVNWTPTTGVWYHVAVTYAGGATLEVKFYVNGVQQGATQTVLTTSIRDGAAAFAIGASGIGGSGPSAYFDGKVSLVRIWKETRTVTQINDNKCNVLGSTTNLSGEWTLDDTVNDNSGNSLTLTNNNSVPFVTDVPSTCATTGPANLKSLDTNVKANIKSYNTNVLANIKSINTNA